MKTDSTGTAGGFQIRDMRGADEAEAAAAIMASTDPWIRLGRAHADTLRTVSDPEATRFVAVAPTGGRGDDVVGVVVIRDLLLFTGYIRVVAVRQDRRNRGVGRALLAHAERHIF